MKIWVKITLIMYLHQNYKKMILFFVILHLGITYKINIKENNKI